MTWWRRLLRRPGLSGGFRLPGPTTPTVPFRTRPVIDPPAPPTDPS